MTDPTPAPDPARRRFFTLQLLRIAGTLIVAAGVLAWQTDLLTPAPNPDMGKALFALGLFTTLVLPALLRRSWRSRD
ncbi:MAG: hypothetical protein Q7J32_13360 [Sphingomonadaceae bacterium]|nr:hypothetical protein [Sphingomonadaceae bacterium]